ITEGADSLRAFSLFSIAIIRAKARAPGAPVRLPLRLRSGPSAKSEPALRNIAERCAEWVRATPLKHHGANLKKRKAYMPAGHLGTKRVGELAELAWRPNLGTIQSSSDAGVAWEDAAVHL